MRSGYILLAFLLAVIFSACEAKKSAWRDSLCMVWHDDGICER